MSALSKLPAIFVVENNQWAIGMAHCRSASYSKNHKKDPAFELPGKAVDGMWVLAVKQVVKKLFEEQEQEKGQHW